MKPFPENFLKTRCKLQPLAIPGVEATVGVEASAGVEAKEEEVVEAEVVAETEEMEATEEIKIKTIKHKTRGQVRIKDILVIRLNVIKILHHFNHVIATGPSARVLISVWNQLPVHGKTSGSRSPINEILTSSTIKEIFN